MGLVGIVINKSERSLGAPLDYLRYISKYSLRLFFKFTKILSFGHCRKITPVEDFHIACLVASKAEDCGTCVQIGVNLAQKDHVAASVIEAVVFDKPEALSDTHRKTFEFAKACQSIAGPSEEQRQEIRTRLGDTGLIELSMGMAAARVFPFVKRTLGYAKSCSKVEIKVK